MPGYAAKTGQGQHSPPSSRHGGVTIVSGHSRMLLDFACASLDSKTQTAIYLRNTPAPQIKKVTCCQSPRSWYAKFVSLSKISSLSIRCLLLSPAMRSNAGMANQTDRRRRALPRKCPPLALWLSLKTGSLLGFLTPEDWTEPETCVRNCHFALCNSPEERVYGHDLVWDYSSYLPRPRRASLCSLPEPAAMYGAQCARYIGAAQIVHCYNPAAVRST